MTKGALTPTSAILLGVAAVYSAWNAVAFAALGHWLGAGGSTVLAVTIVAFGVFLATRNSGS